MTAKTSSAHSSYVGLLPIEPSDDFFRPIDLKPESIELKPEDVPFPNLQPPARKRPRSLAPLIAFCTGVVGTLLWQSYADAAREMIANLYPQLGWLASLPALTAQNTHPSDVIVPAASAAPSAERPNAMSFDFDVVGQNVEKIATHIAAGQEPRMRSTDQMATGQEQTIDNADQTAIGVERVPATKTNNVTDESQGEGASLQPAVGLTEGRPPQTLTEKGKPLSPTSCFASASAVLHHHPGGWPTWTLRAPGHEGTMCWYAAARPRTSERRFRASDHRMEMMPRDNETVETTEKGLLAPPAPYGRGGSWEGGLP
jgi:hypothetical protein